MYVYSWSSSFVVDYNFLIPDRQEQQSQLEFPIEMTSSTTRPRKRRKTATKKNDEEIEN